MRLQCVGEPSTMFSAHKNEMASERVWRQSWHQDNTQQTRAQTRAHTTSRRWLGFTMWNTLFAFDGDQSETDGCIGLGRCVSKVHWCVRVRHRLETGSRKKLIISSRWVRTTKRDSHSTATPHNVHRWPRWNAIILIVADAYYTQAANVYWDARRGLFRSIGACLRQWTPKMKLFVSFAIYLMTHHVRAKKKAAKKRNNQFDQSTLILSTCYRNWYAYFIIFIVELPLWRSSNDLISDDCIRLSFINTVLSTMCLHFDKTQFNIVSLALVADRSLFSWRSLTHQPPHQVRRNVSNRRPCAFVLQKNQ